MYVFLQLFVVDVYSLAFGVGATSGRFIVTHRVVPAAILVILLGTFFWRWKMLWAFLYVVLFPIIVVFWKAPKLIVKARLYRNTVAVIASMNLALLTAKNFRYHLISKCAVVVAAALVIFATGSTLILLGAGVVLVLLVSALVRVVLQTFRPGAFVASQRKLLSLAARVADEPLKLDVAVQPDGAITRQQADQLANAIQTAAITNRLLYLWAYKLQEYRESSFVLAFNALSYASLFMGSTFAFFLLNLAVLRVFPDQFSGALPPSAVALYLYSLSSMAFADGGGLSPSGDLAYSVRILAEVFGPGFLLTVLINTLLVLRGSREDAELGATVKDLRRRARQHEARFQRALRVSIDEACQRLLSLGVGNLVAFLSWFRQVVPSDFLSEEPSSDLM